MSTFTIDVAKDFSPRPFGRYRSDSPDRSAEVFRDTLLWPALSQYDVVNVDLSGSNVYSSSFLEETFGGLIRKYNIDQATLKQKLNVKHRLLPSLVEEVAMYIEAAENRPKKEKKT